MFMYQFPLYLTFFFYHSDDIANFPFWLFFPPDLRIIPPLFCVLTTDITLGQTHHQRLTFHSIVFPNRLPFCLIHLHPYFRLFFFSGRHCFLALCYLLILFQPPTLIALFFFWYLGKINDCPVDSLCVCLYLLYDIFQSSLLISIHPWFFPYTLFPLSKLETKREVFLFLSCFQPSFFELNVMWILSFSSFFKKKFAAPTSVSL